MKDSTISAFAYNIAKEIENTIIARTNDLEETNRTLQALILSYRNSIVNPKELEIFEKHFNVKSSQSKLEYEDEVAGESVAESTLIVKAAVKFADDNYSKFRKDDNVWNSLYEGYAAGCDVARKAYSAGFSTACNFKCADFEEWFGQLIKNESK